MLQRSLLNVYAGIHNWLIDSLPYIVRKIQEDPSKKEDSSMDNDYVLVYTPYITRKGVRIWASQYGLKAFCLRIPRSKYRR